MTVVKTIVSELINGWINDGNDSISKDSGGVD